MSADWPEGAQLLACWRLGSRPGGGGAKAVIVRFVASGTQNFPLVAAVDSHTDTQREPRTEPHHISGQSMIFK